MPFLAAGVVLLDYDSEGAAATNQTASFTLASSDNTPEDQVFTLLLDLTQTGGATNPAATLTVDGSVNGTLWSEIANVATDGTTASSAEPISLSVPRYVRVRLVVAGGTKPAVVASAQLLSSGTITATALA